MAPPRPFNTRLQYEKQSRVFEPLEMFRGVESNGSTTMDDVECGRPYLKYKFQPTIVPPHHEFQMTFDA